jgi:hypothetical protein
MIEDTLRGTGRTTRQLESAPIGSIFVCCTCEQVKYVNSLIRKLGRHDLVVKPLYWLSPYLVRGIRCADVIVDHSVDMNEEQLEAYNILKYTSKI